MIVKQLLLVSTLGNVIEQCGENANWCQGVEEEEANEHFK